MGPLLLGLVTLAILMGALGAFARARVATIKAFAAWVAAIGGLLLGALLFLTGRGGPAIAALGLLAPLVWRWLAHAGSARTFGGASGAASGGTSEGASKATGSKRAGGPRPRGGAMTRAEAYEVLGLAPGASREAILAAHLRLMRAAHPDVGGSDWLATRINQARDVLIG